MSIDKQTYKKQQKTSAEIFFNYDAQPSLVLSREYMTGSVWDHIANSGTFDSYLRRGYDPDELVVLFNETPKEIKRQYPSPSNHEQIFAILKNQRRGIIKRRPRT